jgi:hypothetical protein
VITKLVLEVEKNTQAKRKEIKSINRKTTTALVLETNLHGLSQLWRSFQSNLERQTKKTNLQILVPTLTPANYQIAKA